MLANGKPQAAEAVMKNLHRKQAGGGMPMSPACCAQQLILEAGLCSHLVHQASVADSDVNQLCLKGLLAYELAVALDPSTWYQVSPCKHLVLPPLRDVVAISPSARG